MSANEFTRRGFISGGMAAAASLALPARAVELPPDPTPEELAELRSAWGYFLDPPDDYAGSFPREAKLLGKYAHPNCDVEVWLQNSGPDGMRQRVVKAYPKNSAGRRLPAVVTPFYYPEALLGCAADDPNKVEKWGSVRFMKDLVERGYAVYGADAFHNAIKCDLPRNDWSRHAMAARLIWKDYPTWTMKGKHLFDSMLVVDLMMRDERIDPKRIAAAGHSMGGHMASFLGCWDDRVSAVITSDYGLFPWQSSPEGEYCGKFLALQDSGLGYPELLTLAHGKPFCLLAGMYDTDESFAQMLRAKGYRKCPENLFFVNHATGHRPPPWALEAAYRFLDLRFNHNLG